MKSAHLLSAGGAATGAKNIQQAICSLDNPDEWMEHVVWHFSKYQKCPAVTKRWSLNGLPLRGYQLLRMVKQHYYVRRGVTLRLFPRRRKMSHIRLGKRGVLNNRDEDQSRGEYKESIQLEGYHGTKRSPPYFQRVKTEDMELFKAALPILSHSEDEDTDESEWTDLDNDAFFFWLLGAATCAGGGYDAIAESPDNPNCIGLASEGMENAIEIDIDAPDDIVSWIVNDANKFQSGSGFSAQQLLSVTEEYATSWASRKNDNQWTNKTFGKGPYSHDNQLWTHLKATYQDDLKFRLRTHFEKANGLIYQVLQ